MSLKTPEIFKLEESSFSKPPSNIEDDIFSYNYHPNITPEMIEEINQETELLLKNIENYMGSEKPYLNSDLNLQVLAENLEISRHKLSGILNQQFHMNFYEFVNLYRIEEVKKLMALPENKNLKLISIAYDAGFNSKSSFNRAFKLHAQMTPSEHLKTL